MQLRLDPSTADDGADYVALPAFSSTLEEISIAIEENALDRGVLLLKVMVALQIDRMLETLDAVARAYGLEDYYQAADQLNIAVEALEYLSAPERRVPFPYYFCLPQTIQAHPELTFYCRNVVLLSAKVMQGVGLDTQVYESGLYVPDLQTATELARYFNRIISRLVLTGGATPYRHIQMMMANLGDSLGRS